MPDAVLLVAGDTAAALAMEYLLADAGLAVLRARDRDEACRTLAEAAPGRVVVDAGLDGGGGFAVAEAVCRSARTDRPRLVMIVSRAGSVEHAKAVALGADAVLARPFRGPDLLAALARPRAGDAEGGRQMAADTGGDVPHHG